MDKATFWSLIDATRKKAKGDLDEHDELLVVRLQTLDAAEIVEFHRVFNEYWMRAYTWELWGAAYVIGGGCSDDGFMDFRGWLISKGEQVYEAAMRDPESLLQVVTEDDGDCQYEGFHYAASRAWEEKTGGDLNDFPGQVGKHPDQPAGKAWREDNGDLEKRFPKLCKKFMAE